MLRPFLLALLLAGCSSPAPADPADPFDPLTFFTGTSHGEGKLKIITKAATAVHVESHGVRTGPDAITLDQTVREGTKPPRQRRWLLRRTSPTTFGGTLSDARSPIEGRLVDNRLLLNFQMKGGLDAEQILSLQPGGRTLLNRMVVRKFGMVVARLDEVITRAP